MGYPTDDSRATLVVNGPVSDGTGHTTAVDGTCTNCGGVKLRNIQVSTFTFRISRYSLASYRSMELVWELPQQVAGRT